MTQYLYPQNLKATANLWLWSLKDFCVLGIAGEMPGNSWRYMKTHIASPPEFLGRFVRESDFSVYMTGKAPVVHATPAYALWNASIRVNCFFNDVAMCRIIISIPTPDIDKGIVQFAEYVGTVIERIPASKAHRFFTENIGNTTSMLKFDCEIDKNDEVFLKTKEQFDQCPFRLCRLSMKEPINDRTIYYWLCSQLEALIVESYCFPYQDDIIMIVPATTAVERRISSAIPTLLDHTGFFCTVSNQYEQVESIRECYQQTCGLEKFARPRYQHVYYYEDSALERLVEEIVRQKDWTAWISGSITTLEEYDNAHKTDFLDTLYCLVKYQFVFSHVASALHIHRNSLQYRVSKIEALTGINLSNADQRFFLSLSCRLHKANPKFNSR